MLRETVRTTAFALPLTSSAFPTGPYRFIDREYFIIRYRTDPEALRRVVPEPLAVAERGVPLMLAHVASAFLTPPALVFFSFVLA